MPYDTGRETYQPGEFRLGAIVLVLAGLLLHALGGVLVVGVVARDVVVLDQMQEHAGGFPPGAFEFARVIRLVGGIRGHHAPCCRAGGLLERFFPRLAL